MNPTKRLVLGRALRLRWLRFNLVGIAGFGVQTLALVAMTRGFAVPIAPAIVVAVLAAVSHNFLWHEFVTWPGRPRETLFLRWVAFHLSNGAVSLVVNLVVTPAMIVVNDAPLLAANVTAVTVASVANFLISDRLVFGRRTPGQQAPPSRWPKRTMGQCATAPAAPAVPVKPRTTSANDDGMHGIWR